MNSGFMKCFVSYKVMGGFYQATRGTLRQFKLGKL